MTLHDPVFDSSGVGVGGVVISILNLNKISYFIITTKVNRLKAVKKMIGWQRDSCQITCFKSPFFTVKTST